MSRLVVVEGQGVDRHYDLQDMTLIGRDPRCQVPLASREVSAHHARLIRVGSGFLLEDLQSRNHTYVNGEAVSRCRLKNGDRLRVGRTTFRFESHAAASTTADDRSALTLNPQSDRTLDMDASRIPRLNVSPSEGARLKGRMALLLGVAETLSQARGLKSTLDGLLNTLLETYPQAARAAVLLCQGAALVPITSIGKDGRPGEQGYSETIARRALGEGRGLLSVDALSDDRFSESHSVVDLRLRSVMCAPIFFQGEGLGVLELDTVSSPQMFSEEDLSILSAVAGQVGAFIANARLVEDYQALLLNQVSAMTLAMDARPAPGKGHGERVSRVAQALGRRLGLGGEALEDLRLASLLHDVGLLSLPEAVLDGPEPLAEEDQRLMEVHPLRSVEILEPIKELHRILPAVRSHHEAYDGSGYPDGLRGSDIPLGARILAIADAYDALTTPHPHRPALAPAEALERLQSEVGARFDPEVMAPMTRLVQSLSRREARRGHRSPEGEDV